MSEVHFTLLYWFIHLSALKRSRLRENFALADFSIWQTIGCKFGFLHYVRSIIIERTITKLLIIGLRYASQKLFIEHLNISRKSFTVEIIRLKSRNISICENKSAPFTEVQGFVQHCSKLWSPTRQSFISTLNLVKFVSTKTKTDL